MTIDHALRRAQEGTGVVQAHADGLSGREEARSSAVRDVVWALSPCGRPDPDLVVAAGRADALGVLDLGAGGDRAREALATTAARARVPFGVRVGATCPVTAAELPEAVDTVVVAGPDLVSAFRGVGDRRVVAEVVSAAEGRLAIEAGADGLVAKGPESAGRVGTTGAYVLLQQLVDLVGRTGATDEAGADLPVWAHGGIGAHTIAAAVAGGAAGVVVDTQLALLRGSTLARALRSVIGAMDGSETRVVGGYRVYARPDLWVAGLPADTPAAEVAAALQGDVLTGTVAVPVGQDGCLPPASSAAGPRWAGRSPGCGRRSTSTWAPPSAPNRWPRATASPRTSAPRSRWCRAR